MKFGSVAIGLACCIGSQLANAQARADWFTVTGNPGDPSVDTVQVDPVALSSEGVTKTMNVRVSRAVPRVNWDKLPYRSYESQVVFDCQARRASYAQVRYFMEPLWRGEPSAVGDYTANPRPMLFRDMEPNPVSRIVRAACRLRTG